MNDTYLDSLQAYAEANAPETQCPHCGEKYVVMRGEGEYECNECGKSFWVTFLIEFGKFVDCISHLVDPVTDPALLKFNARKPEQPNLTHVATTLQFCAEQLQLCEQVVQKENLPEFLVALEEASYVIDRAMKYLRQQGIKPTPTPAEPEGAVPA